MSTLTRFSVSVEEALLARFDERIDRLGYPTRSKAVADLIRESLVEKDWKRGREVAAAIVMVYDHHKRNLSDALNRIQHDHHKLIISTQHVHLDHDNCLEIVVVRGKPTEVDELARKLKTTKGVGYCSLAAASMGTAE